jgi:hypothetical protein
VRKERLPVTDYLTWLSWVCRDRIACRERRSLEGDTGIPSSENWRD